MRLYHDLQSAGRCPAAGPARPAAEVRMLSDHMAPDLHFAGLGATGKTVAEASERLALALRHWVSEHDGCRVVQLTVLPAGPLPAAHGGDEPAFGLTATIVFLDGGLAADAAAEAVAAAVEEIQQAQAPRSDEDFPRFV